MSLFSKKNLTSIYLITLFALFNLVLIRYLNNAIERIDYYLHWKPLSVVLTILFILTLILLNKYIWFRIIKQRIKKVITKYLLRTRQLRDSAVYVFLFLVLVILFLFRFWNIELIVEKRYRGLAQIVRPLIPGNLGFLRESREVTEGYSATPEETEELIATHKYSDYGRFLRTYRWHSVISQTEKRYNIEQNLLAGLIMQESMGNPLELNSGDDGGAGLMMFQPGTAMEYGLKIYGSSRATGRDLTHGKQLRSLVANKNGNYQELSRLDERFHIEKSVDAGARFLARLYGQHHSWDKAVSAYNRGKPAVAPATTRHVRQVRYFQNQYSFYLKKVQG